LARYNEHLQGAQQLHETWLRQKAETEQLKLSLRQLNDKIEEAKRKKNILIARAKRAEAQQRIQETMSGLSDKSAFEAFDRMAERIEQNERMALAAASVSEELTGDNLEREFKQLESGGDSEIDYKLLAMKQQLGILPAPAPAESRQLGAGQAQEPAPAQPAAAAAPASASSSNGQGPITPPAPADAGGSRIHEAELLEEFEALEEEERGRA
jgi:phage shock protein A